MTGEPVVEPDKLAERRTQTQWAIDRLTQIIDSTGTPTAAQLFEGIRDIARIQRALVRYSQRGDTDSLREIEGGGT